MKILEHTNTKSQRDPIGTQKHTNTLCFSVLVFKCLSDRKGMAALLTVVIVGAATLLMAFSAIILGLGELEMGYASQQGEETFQVANGCLEESLLRLRINSTTYNGGILNLGSGSCIIGISGTGNERLIMVTGTVGDYNKYLQVKVDLEGGEARIGDWKETSN